ncbi:MAG: hypothetical protein HY544_00360 [Candidatus Diapherotrites archaeon]|uniref:Uncharacterized protein n=1 Tax=Candidatus Iainarchaeum sp. TaxID=3101447 RepID=A0A8T3YIS5_9ARCH|nr:hypothetical protein [Candidatus Diapherotrites archaeon]
MDNIAELVRLCQGKELPGGIAPDGFVRALVKRVELEYRMDTGGPPTHKPFSRFVDRETHFLLVDSEGYRWNSDLERFEGIDHDTYILARRRVLAAIISSACENFVLDENSLVPRQPDVYVRMSVKPYLDVQTDLSSKVEA